MEAMEFQFQHGSIKRPKLITPALPVGQFQFQHGSIKSWRAWGDLMQAIVFQFQHGSIKRKYFVCCCYTFSNLNSNMVRLKVKFEIDINGLATIFQFQHGSIKSKY